MKPLGGIFMFLLLAKAQKLTPDTLLEKRFKTYVSLANDTLNNHIQKQCPLVLGHTLLTVPKIFNNWLSEVSKSRTIYTFQLPRTDPALTVITEAPDENATLSRREYPFPSNPKSKATGNCSFYVLLFQDLASLGELFEEIIRHITLKLQRDYFLFLYTSTSPIPEDVKDVFMDEFLINSTYTYGMRYKLFPMIENEDVDVPVQLVAACFYCDAGYAKIVPIAKYHPTTGFTELTQLYPDFTGDMMGRYQHIVFIQGEKGETIKNLVNSGEPVFMAYRIMYMMSFMMNFTFDLHMIDIGMSGAFDRFEDGVWIGFVGDVLYKKADFAMGSVMTSLAVPYIEYSSVLVVTKFLFATAKAQVFYTPWVILEPFAFNLWMAILVAILGSTVALGWLMKHEDDCTLFRNWSTFYRYFWSFHFLSFSITGWGTENLPVKAAPQIFMSCWLLYGIIISFFYQSELTSSMTFPRKERIPNTYFELLQMGYEYSGEGMINSYFQLLLQETEMEHLITIRDNLHGYHRIEECLEAALIRRLGCICIPDVMFPAIFGFLDDDYELRHVVHRDDGASLLGASILPKDYPSHYLYSKRMTFGYDAGFRDQIEKEDVVRRFRKGLRAQRAINKLKKDSEFINKNEMPLGSKHMTAPFLFLGIGCGVAVFLFIYENTARCKKGNVINVKAIA